MSLPANKTLPEALKILGIEEYGQRIFNSNSRGELSHVRQYFLLAEKVGTTKWFPEWFKSVVESAEKEWERPESVFQHISRILSEQLTYEKAQRSS